jgi:sugar lactone lactonase YvrE
VARLAPDGRNLLFRIDPFRDVLDLAFEADGSFWAADYANGEVLQYDREGGVLASWEFYGADTVVPDSRDGQIWVGSFDQQSVALFDRNGRLLWTDPGAGLVEVLAPAHGGGAWVGSRSLGLSRVDAGQVLFRLPDFSWPVGLGVEADGTLWVVDRGNKRISKISADGESIRSSDLYVDPTGGTPDSAGGFWVADRGAGGVSHLDRDLHETAFLPIGAAQGVTWDPAGKRLWVTYGSEGKIAVVEIRGEPGHETGEVTATLEVGGSPVRVDAVWRR